MRISLTVAVVVGLSLNAECQQARMPTAAIVQRIESRISPDAALTLMAWNWLAYQVRQTPEHWGPGINNDNGTALRDVEDLFKLQIEDAMELAYKQHNAPALEAFRSFVGPNWSAKPPFEQVADQIGRAADSAIGDVDFGDGKPPLKKQLPLDPALVAGSPALMALTKQIQDDVTPYPAMMLLSWQAIAVESGISHGTALTDERIGKLRSKLLETLSDLFGRGLSAEICFSDSAKNRKELPALFQILGNTAVITDFQSSPDPHGHCTAQQFTRMIAASSDGARHSLSNEGRISIAKQDTAVIVGIDQTLQRTSTTSPITNGGSGFRIVTFKYPGSEYPTRLSAINDENIAVGDFTVPEKSSVPCDTTSFRKPCLSPGTYPFIYANENFSFIKRSKNNDCLTGTRNQQSRTGAARKWRDFLSL